MSDPTPASPADRQHVRITRTFEASREEVFRAWTDPDEVASWYGPKHMHAPREQIRIDPRVGGRWELTMVRRGGQGDAMPIGYEIVELVTPELLVMRADPMPAMGMAEGNVLRIELHDRGKGITEMVLTDGPFPTAAAPHAEAGWTAAFDTLAAQLRS